MVCFLCILYNTGNIKPHARPAAGNRVAGRCGAASVVGPKSAAVAADGGGTLLQV